MTLPETIARLEELEKAARAEVESGAQSRVAWLDWTTTMQDCGGAMLACVKALKATPCKCRNLPLDEIPGSLLNDGVTSVAVTCSRCAALAQFLAAVGGEE